MPRFHRARLLLRAALACAAAVSLMSLLAYTTPPTPGSGAALQGAIDVPANNATAGGPTTIQGWAIDTGDNEGSGIARVSIYLDGVFIKDAHLGFVRDDIAAGYGTRFLLSGWRALLDLDSIANRGAHQIQVHAISSVSGSEVVFTRELQVTARQRFGVDAHLLWFDPTRAANDLNQIRANGLDLVRLDVAWDAFEPNQQNGWDADYLARLDDALDLGAARGEHVILVVVGTPAWARGNAGSRMTPPSDAATFGAALRYLAMRYAQRPDMVYEIWNEPNQSQFWDAPARPDAVAYTRLLTAAYAAVKGAAPSATVLGGSVAFNDPDYIEALYAAGTAGQFDGLALHPYSDANAPEATSNPSRSFVLALDQARQILSAHGDRDKPIWVTEMGWSTQDITDTTRADYLRRAVALVRARNDIAAFCAYGLNQGDDYPDSGLVGANGAPTASWDAYGRAVQGR